MPFPAYPEHPHANYAARQRGPQYGCLLALASLVLFTLVIWGGCAAAYRAQRESARQQETIDAYNRHDPAMR